MNSKEKQKKQLIEKYKNTSNELNSVNETKIPFKLDDLPEIDPNDPDLGKTVGEIQAEKFSKEIVPLINPLVEIYVNSDEKMREKIINIINEDSNDSLQDLVTNVLKKLPKHETKKYKKSQPLAYKHNKLEAAPNHFNVVDMLTEILRPADFNPKLTETTVTVEIRHDKPKNKKYPVTGYTALQLPLLDKDLVGDFVPANLDTIFDFLDYKILNILFVEGLKTNEEFIQIDVMDFLKLIKENTRTIDGKRFSKEDILLDFERRMNKLSSIKMTFEYTTKKETYNHRQVITGQKKYCGIFDIKVTHTENGIPIAYGIILDYWFRVNKDEIQQFTFFPKWLFEFNSYQDKMAFLIVEYVLRKIRNNRKNICNSGKDYDVISVKSFMDKILSNTEKATSKIDSDKGKKLKYRFLNTLKKIEETSKKSSEGWHFKLLFNPNGMGFNDFYSDDLKIEIKLDQETTLKILKDQPVISLPPTLPSKVNRQVKTVDTTAVKMTLYGADIKQVRKKAKLNQKTLAEMMYCTQPLISQLENDLIIPTETFEKRFREIFAQYL